MWLRLRLRFLARALGPQLLALALAALLLRSLDSAAPALPGVLDGWLDGWLSPQHPLRRAAVASLAWLCQRCGQVVAHPLEKGGVLWLSLLAAWYFTDLAVTGRKAGWQVIAPYRQGRSSSVGYVWLKLASGLAALVALVVCLLTFRGNLVQLAQDAPPVQDVLRRWDWRTALTVFGLADTFALWLALVRQQAFTTYETQIRPELERQRQQRLEQRTQAKAEQQKQRRERAARHNAGRQVRAFYRQHAYLLAPVFSTAVLDAELSAVAGDHVSAGDATRGAAELLAELERLAAQERDKVLAEQRRLQQLTQEIRTLQEQIGLARQEHNRLTAQQLDTGPVEEYLAHSRQRLETLQQELARLQAQLPERI